MKPQSPFPTSGTFETFLPPRKQSKENLILSLILLGACAGLVWARS